MTTCLLRLFHFLPNNRLVVFQRDFGISDCSAIDDFAGGEGPYHAIIQINNPLQSSDGTIVNSLHEEETNPSQFMNPLVSPSGGESMLLEPVTPPGLIKPPSLDSQFTFAVRKNARNALSRQLKKTLSGSYSVKH